MGHFAVDWATDCGLWALASDLSRALSSGETPTLPIRMAEGVCTGAGKALEAQAYSLPVTWSTFRLSTARTGALPVVASATSA
jgi:hypothetical protein